MKRFLNFTALAMAVFAIAVTLSSLLTPMQAVPAPILLSQNVNFKPPRVTAPDNRQAGTHRGPTCPPDLSIIPLIPESKIGLTLTESPTFFAYISDSSTQVEFSLQANDEEGTEVYKTTFKVDKPGIVEVSIPAIGDSQKSLEIGQRYQWMFLVACNKDDVSEEGWRDWSGDYYVQGIVQRIEAEETLKNDLANPDPMARAMAYAKNGIWYETLATLAQMRRLAPDDSGAMAEWTQLLQSQGLKSIAAQPLVQSVE
jgi:hypothetical protein